jgi:hypothetical protein
VVGWRISLNYGLSVVETSESLVDPWRQLFEQAEADRPDEADDLEPYWIYEPSGSGERMFKIERRIPVLPFSREIGRMESLKRSLVAYRSVIGQPRQQELLEFLEAHIGKDEIQEFAKNAAIDLSPPKR